mmetsp:Transcript_16873/g.16225  ORF Transcript_16873/g.16225 Transcript_16873/m.16225 type:complete len:214 (-) Transcript_16873:1218-1859(-)
MTTVDVEGLIFLGESTGTLFATEVAALDRVDLAVTASSTGVMTVTASSTGVVTVTASSIGVMAVTASSTGVVTVTASTTGTGVAALDRVDLVAVFLELSSTFGVALITNGVAALDLVDLEGVEAANTGIEISHSAVIATEAVAVVVMVAVSSASISNSTDGASIEKASVSTAPSTSTEIALISTPSISCRRFSPSIIKASSGSFTSTISSSSN